MDEESDQELEETKWWNLVYIHPHPQKMKMTPRKQKLRFRLQEPGIRQIS